MKSTSREYQRLANELVRGFAPPVEQCGECGHPKLEGYVCKPCYERAHAIAIARHDIIQEMKVMFPGWLPPADLSVLVTDAPVKAKVVAGPRKSAPAPMPKRDKDGRAKLRSLLYGEKVSG